MPFDSGQNALRPGPAVGQTEGFVRALWLVWVIFVVYGSLVPLEFHALSFDEALARFARVPMLNIGVEGRADWIANGVLYIPVGFLTAVWLGGESTFRRLLSSVLALSFGCFLAVSVEFAQLYFPQRTVSLNDLMAEGMGTALGVVLAWRGRAWLASLLKVLRGHWREVAASLAPAGALLVLTVSLFPFDLLVSSAELGTKLTSPFWGWLVAPVFAQESGFRQAARLFAEVAVLVPLGALWARSVLVGLYATNARASLSVAFWLGASLGVLIEVGQWFVSSGVSQGISMFTRGFGWLLGAWLWNRRHVWDIAQWQAVLRRFVLPLAVLHVLAVLVLSGWASGNWRTPGDALARLFGGEVSFVPFFYHYYTTEAVALQSLLNVGLMYAPVGLWSWALRLTVHQSAWIAAGLAVLVEAGKLFPLTSRPDPTNILIAVGAAALSTLLLQRFSEPSRMPAADLGQSAEGAVHGGVVKQGWAGQHALLLLPLFAGVAFWLSNFPVYQWLVALVLTVSGVLVWRRPVWVFGIAAAALPSLDLSALSGREYVDEFDVLLLVMLAIAWMRQPAGVSPPVQDRWLSMAMVAFALSALVAALVAWRPWELSALQNPHTPMSPWYALRLIKGLFWAWCLFLLARRHQASGLPVVQAFAVGLVLGLAYVSCFILWERAVFVGVWDFSTPYRVAGPMVPMRLGGAYLDAFLVAAMPFALVGAWFGRALSWRVFCSVTALAAMYGVAVTFTRTTYLAVAVVCLLITLVALGNRSSKKTSPVLGLLVLVAMAATAFPVFTGSFASARFSVVEQDLRVRMDHFAKAVRLGRSDAQSFWVGNGLGSFPRENYWASVVANDPHATMAVHRFMRQDGADILQMGAGPHLYLDQFVSVPHNETVQLTLKARADDEAGALYVSICEKWLLYSKSCVVKEFGVPALGDVWQTTSAAIFTGPLGNTSTWLSRPVRLALHNTGAVRIDVSEISLRNAQGMELLRNGRFDNGSDHWSYTSDDHLAWHIKNMFISVWFDQGMLGLLALTLLLGLGLVRSARAVGHGDPMALALCTALVGLLIVAVFDSITDEPRYLLLMVWVVWMASLAQGPKPAKAAVGPGLPRADTTESGSQRFGTR